jgi:hypothetical protein
VLAGFKEEEVESLSREKLMETWAEQLTVGKGSSAAVVLGAAHVEIERKRLQFEKNLKRKWRLAKGYRSRKRGSRERNQTPGVGTVSFRTNTGGGV